MGNGAVGKSSMIQRYCRGTFTKTYKKTIGVDFLEKQLRVHGEDVRLMLWDTAGQEEFDAITKVSIVSVLNLKAAFNQEKALVGAFSVIANLCMDLFEALVNTVPGGTSQPSTGRAGSCMSAD